MILINVVVSPGFGIEEQDINEIITSEKARFTPSEVQERLLGHDQMPASENPRNLSIVSDSTLPASLHRSSNEYMIAMPEDGSSKAGVSLKNYPPKILWNSIWLQRVVLIGFGSLFAALFVALVLLYYFSGVDHGLSTQISRNKYSWTYGPTAG